MESILTSIKKLLGPGADYGYFDSDLIMHINSALAVLTQIGVGPSKGFAIVDESEEWEEFIKGDPAIYSEVKTYVFLKVKLVFDPPQSSALIESINRQISELEWRLSVVADQEKNKGKEEKS